MAFIYDDHAVFSEPRFDFVGITHGLQHGDIDNAAAGIFIGPIQADDFPLFLSPSALGLRRQNFVDDKKLRQSFLPLLHQLGTVNEDKRVYFLLRNQRSADDSLAESGCCRKNTGIMGRKRFKSGLLLLSQFAVEGDVYISPEATFVNALNVDLICLQPLHHIVCTTAGKCKKIALILGAADDTGNIPHRHAHGLISVILRIAESCDTFELILRAVGKVLNRDVNSVCKRNFCAGWNILRLYLRLLSLPWFAVLFFILRAQRSERRYM